MAENTRFQEFQGRTVWYWIRPFMSGWTWVMAWRDSRSSRKHLLFFSSSIVLGIAALVAISSFGRNLRAAIEDQAKSLLGADLVIASRQQFTDDDERFLSSLGGTQSREINFSSMLYFPASQGTHLVQVRSLSGDFPFYGRLETEPETAAEAFREGRGALIEESVLIQYNSRVGDEIKLGELLIPVVGSLKKVPGETVMFATVSPRVYIPMSKLEETGLLKTGSLARYKTYFKFGPEVNIARLAKKIRPELNARRMSDTTVEERKKDLGNAMANLHNFLQLAGFIALLLGAVGVASAISVHIKHKLDTVAVLRCLGSSVPQTFAIYLIQAAALGLAGAIVGAGLGIAVQKMLPRVVSDFVPFSVSFFTSWLAVLEAIGIGFGICFLFGLLPLLSVRFVSPLAAIRSSYESTPAVGIDPFRWAVYGLIGAALISFSLAHTERWTHGLGFAAGLVAAFVLLIVVAHLVAWTAKKLLRPGLPYIWRQGIANLYRPNNRTALLMLSLGLGTFLVLTLYLTQRTLLKELINSRQPNQANTILFDIQADQKKGVEDLIRDQKLKVLDHAPIVTMRIKSIKGRPTEELLNEKGDHIPNWALRREYRSTYRTELRDAERIVAGNWTGARVESDAKGAIPVSIEEGIAQDLRVRLGDEVIFDVQGVSIHTQISSLRHVDWKRVQPNFFFVFPPGVLEDAPGFHVLVTRTESASQSALLQRAVVQQFPNVSVIDITRILETVDSVLSKVSFVIRFMALFTVLTGLLVLIGALLTSRFQRIQESILLRTLGASRRQVLRILIVEYGCLGAMAALTGIVLSVGASWALTHFVFHVKFVVPALSLAIPLLLVTALTMFIGLLMSRGVLNHPPLAVLRSET